jgi:hypothetical protein
MRFTYKQQTSASTKILYRLHARRNRKRNKKNMGKLAMKKPSFGSTLVE